jgi:hypothetical protein
MRTDGQKDRRTDIANLIVAFRNFANATKKSEDSLRYLQQVLTKFHETPSVVSNVIKIHHLLTNFKVD